MNIRHKETSPDLQIKLVVVVFLTLVFVGLILVSAIFYQGKIAPPKGLLGTRASILSDLNLIAQFVLLIGLSWGVLLARRGHYKAHQYIQTSMVLLNLVLALSIMVESYIRKVVPGMPGNLTTAFGVVSTIHAGIGFLAVAGGIYLLLRMNRLLPESMRTKNWKNLMRLTFGLYWTAGMLGLALYYIWYVL